MKSPDGYIPALWGRNWTAPGDLCRKEEARRNAGAGVPACLPREPGRGRPVSAEKPPEKKEEIRGGEKGAGPADGEARPYEQDSTGRGRRGRPLMLRERPARAGRCDWRQPAVFPGLEACPLLAFIPRREAGMRANVWPALRLCKNAASAIVHGCCGEHKSVVLRPQYSRDSARLFDPNQTPWGDTL